MIRHALKCQQLIDPSGTGALPSGMIELNVPSINFEFAGEQPLGTSHGLVMPTSNTVPTMEQQPQTSPLMNQLIDMILSFQNQMQQMQQKPQHEVRNKVHKWFQRKAEREVAMKTTKQLPRAQVQRVLFLPRKKEKVATKNKYKRKQIRKPKPPLQQALANSPE